MKIERPTGDLAGGPRVREPAEELAPLHGAETKAPVADAAGVPAAVSGPLTQAADRTRLATPAPRSGGIADVMIGRGQIASSNEIRARILGTIELSSHPARRLATRALERLLETDEGTRVAVGLYLDHRTVTDRDLATLPKPGKLSPDAVVERLAFWLEKPAAAEVLAGAPPELREPLVAAFRACADAALEARAVAYIKSTRKERSTWMIVGFLEAIGELTTKDGARRLADGARALAALARRQEGLERQVDGVIPELPEHLLDAPSDVSALAVAFRTPTPRTPPAVPEHLGALDEPSVTETLAAHGLGSERGNRRGNLGELLRLRALQEAPETRDKVLMRGFHLASSPPELRTARTYDEALAWAERQSPPVDPNTILRFQTQAGTFYAIDRTEMDLAILEPHGERLRFVRLENVKAGLGHSQDARHQNEVARATLADAASALVLVGPKDGVYEDVSARLELGEEAMAHVALETVGPKDDPRYRIALPLTGWDLSQLALRL